MIIMSLTKVLSVRLITVCLIFLLSACSLPYFYKSDSFISYNNDLVKPQYRSGQFYMPVAYQGKMAWVKRVFQDAVSNQILLDVWVGSQNQIIRTHQGGRVVEVLGYDETPSRLIDDCPNILVLYKLNRELTCKRTYLTSSQGKYKTRIYVTLKPAIATSLIFGNKKQDGLIVREYINASNRKGNFYFYDLQGNYVMSRQWLDFDRYIDVYAMEKGE